MPVKSARSAAILSALPPGADPSHQADARFPARRDVLTRDGCGDSLRLPEGALVSSENLRWGFQSELRVELAH